MRIQIIIDMRLFKLSSRIVMIFLIAILSGLKAKSQSEPAPFYFVTNERDTTFCMSLDYGTNTQGFLDHLTFIKTNGEEIDIKGEYEVPNVVTFYMEGITYDRIPYDLDMDFGDYAYSERKVNGDIKVYLDRKINGQSDVYRFYVRLDDGSYVNVKGRSNMNRHIKPALLTCEDFSDSYQGEFSSDEVEFLAMVSFYNFLCD